MARVVIVRVSEDLNLRLLNLFDYIDPLRQLLAAAGFAQTNRELVADSLQQPLVKTGGQLVQHARYYWLLLAEGHLNRRRFGAMRGWIALLPVPTG